MVRLEKEGIYLFTYKEPDPYSSIKSICFHICELFIPCSQRILYIALRNQKSTLVFTKGMDTHYSVWQMSCIWYYFCLKYCWGFFCLKYFCSFGGEGALWRASGAQKLFVYTSQSHIIGFQSSNQRDNQRLFLMHFMGRKKHLMLYPRGKISDWLVSYAAVTNLAAW